MSLATMSLMRPVLIRKYSTRYVLPMATLCEKLQYVGSKNWFVFILTLENTHTASSHIQTQVDSTSAGSCCTCVNNDFKRTHYTNGILI